MIKITINKTVIVRSKLNELAENSEIEQYLFSIVNNIDCKPALPMHWL